MLQKSQGETDPKPPRRKRAALESAFRGALLAGRLSSLAAGGLLAAATVLGQPPENEGNQLVLGESSASVLRLENEAEPWLGVSVQKPKEELYSRLEGIPEGVGFVVHSVAMDGPAAAAGLRQYDFLWKLGDQLLVNEAQFLVLLHLHRVGDSVTLTFQRAEEDHEVKVVLTERPSSETGRREADVAVMSDPPVPGLPKQMVDTLRQVATIKGDDNVTVRLERRGEVFRWQQIAADGMVIQEGDVKGVDDIRFEPGTNEELARKLRALIRAYEDAEKRAESGVRPPRVRRVPVEDPKKVPNR